MIFLLSISVVVITACTGRKKTAGIAHYKEEQFTMARHIADSGLLQKAVAYIDSVYRTFPEISIRDKVMYYRGLIDIETTVSARYKTERFSEDAMPKAYYYLDSAIALIEQNGLQKEMSESYAELLGQKGQILFLQDRKDEAISYFFLIREIGREKGDSCAVAITSSNLGGAMFHKKEYDKAIGFYKDEINEAIHCQINERSRKYYYMQGALDNIGICYEKMGQIDSAIVYYHKAEEYIITQRDLYSDHPAFVSEALYVVYNNLTGLHLGQKNYNTARTFIDKCDSLNNNILQNPVLTSRNKLLRAELAMQEGDYLSAYRQVSGGPAIPEAEPDIGFQIKWLELRRKISRAMGDSRRELDYQHRYYTLKDSLYQERIMHFNPIKEFERMETNAEAALLEITTKRQKTSGLYIAMTSVFSIIILTVLTRAAIKRRKRKQEEERLKVKKLEEEIYLQAIKAQAEHIEAVRLERNEISDNLHDELSSSLAALKYFVEDVKSRVSNKESQKHLTDVAEEVASIYQGARSYMHSLKTNVQEGGYDLVNFLDDIRRKFAERNLLQIDLAIDREGIRERLDAKQHDQLYYVLKEGLSNVIRHSNATKALVKIGVQQNLCFFELEDNGRGYDEQSAEKGMGLNSMKSRMKTVKGEINFRRGAGGGAVLYGSFPLEE